MLLRCSALLGHHVSDSSLSLTLPTGHRYSVDRHLLLLLNCASTPSTTLDASVISDKVRIEVTGASVYLHCRHSVGLLQRYTIAGTSDVNKATTPKAKAT